ncbi:MAG TPA: hypothetical protein VMQ10_08715 [Spirochaetia bacterium]|nr:hypothetical protein [Spirochaetia bacterium]
MKRPLDPSSRAGPAPRDDAWLADQLLRASAPVRAPRGFSQRVMEAVYREALAGAPAARPAVRAARLYRRLALSFMITAGVLTVSLLLPHGAYPTLIGAAAGKALGTGPSVAVQTALSGASDAVQGALGERVIGGGIQ